jgi:tRNA pseudouridine38-40 synthase
MKRYLIEVVYKGTNYCGFQAQPNGISIQSAIENAFEIFYKKKFEFTCSSRTDTGVHALQNFFHVDSEIILDPKHLYNLNALLQKDIFIKQITQVSNQFHARFSATHRRYKYYITREKNPFLTETAWHYPYNLNLEKLQEASKILLNYSDFTSFSKKKTQVKTFICAISISNWYYENDCLVYEVKANRFLRGMVKGLVGTMLLVGRELISTEDFKRIIESKDCTKANFSTPATGLFLIEVSYPSIQLEQ